MVECYGSEFEVPDILVNKYLSDFEVLPGSRHREGVEQLRAAIYEVVDVIGEEPDLLEEFEYRSDFIKALAMKHAMEKLGILYDA